MLVGSYLNVPKGHAAAAAAKSLQSCPTLCDPIDGSKAAQMFYRGSLLFLFYCSSELF